MKIIMLETKSGVRDGQVYPETFQKGKSYEILGGLLDTFISHGWASPEKEETVPVKVSQIKPEAKEIDLTGYTKKQLIAFASEQGLEVDENQKHSSLYTEVTTKYKEKLNASV